MMLKRILISLTSLPLEVIAQSFQQIHEIDEMWSDLSVSLIRSIFSTIYNTPETEKVYNIWYTTMKYKKTDVMNLFWKVVGRAETMKRWSVSQGGKSTGNNFWVKCDF